MTKVSVCESSDYSAAEAIVERTVAEEAPPLAGRRVFIKPNVLGPCPPDDAVTTHPSLVAAAVRACRTAGAAEIVVGDNPGMTSYGTTDHACRVAGIVDAADGCYRNIAESPRLVDVDIPGVDRLPIASAVLDADVVISLPKMKTHVATGMTGAVKNTFGYVVGAAKTRLHALCVGPERFARAILRVYAIRPPDLSIMDAVWAMEGQGPSGGHPRFVGRVLVSKDAVALDMVASRMMGFGPRDVRHLAVARKWGLGPADASQVDVEGPADPIGGFRRPPLGLALGTVVAGWIGRLYATQPRANHDKCVRCGACARQCPVDAIRLAPYPVVDAGLCISCFCCHEFCKYKAMDLAPRVRLFQFLRRTTK